MSRRIEIVEYDPEWPKVFSELRAGLTDALGPFARRIEHVGSTSVPGLAAKPVVDLDVVIADRADLPEVIARLRPLGYRHEGDLGVPGREAFTTPPRLAPHHLYVCDAGNDHLRQHLTFRDHLRAHPETAAAYARLKRTLARRFPGDREAYGNAKSAFVTEVLNAATLDLPRPGGHPGKAE